MRIRSLKRVCLSLITAALAAVLMASTPVAASSSPFSDLSQKHWGYSAILNAYDLGIVGGYEDGSFRPNASVNQAEFLAMLARSFPDDIFIRKAKSNEAWYKPYYDAAEEQGIVYIDKAPADIMFNRGDVAEMIYSLIFGGAASEQHSVLFLLESGISNGKTSKTVDGYKSKDILTRAEAVTFLANVTRYVDSEQNGDLYALRGLHPTFESEEKNAAVKGFLGTTMMEIPLDMAAKDLHRILGEPDSVVPTSYPYTWHGYNIGGGHLRYAIADKEQKVVGFFTNMNGDVLDIAAAGLSIGKDNVKTVAEHHGTAGQVTDFIYNKDVDITIYYDNHTSNKDIDAILFLKSGYGRIDSGKIVDEDELATAYEQGIFDITNSYRFKHGIQTPLVFDEGMSAVARAHSQDMIDKGYFDHTGRDGRSPFDRMKDAGFRYSWAGENIAMGYGSDIAVMNGWINSEGHRENILVKEFTHLGVGVVGYTYTQNFYTPR